MTDTLTGPIDPATGRPGRIFQDYESMAMADYLGDYVYTEKDAPKPRRQRNYPAPNTQESWLGLPAMPLNLPPAPKGRDPVEVKRRINRLTYLHRDKIKEAKASWAGQCDSCRVEVPARSIMADFTGEEFAGLICRKCRQALWRWQRNPTLLATYRAELIKWCLSGCREGACIRKDHQEMASRVVKCSAYLFRVRGKV